MFVLGGKGGSKMKSTLYLVPTYTSKVPSNVHLIFLQKFKKMKERNRKKPHKTPGIYLLEVNS